MLVQVIKESIGTKGPTLSTYISIPGRYLVLMPGLNRVGVSRKIVDEGQRRKLREIMNELNPPKGLGFIVRTAGLERTKRELARDLAYLLRLWKVILRRIKKAKAPTPIYQESDMIIRTIRDIFTSEIDTIWIDEPAAFERAQDFLRVVMPRFVNRLKLYDEKVPLFHKYGIEDEIAKIQRRHVPLPEGGSIVIDQTEALVAIDVNSGNFRVEDDAERTAYEMNLRAAKEIARQLRLRDLGGVIVNDFIDMREERHRRGVERALREAIKRDRARTKVLRMSAFGLIEMTRQRIRPSLKRSVYEDCPQCTGAGVVKTAESMAIDVMRLLALATHREEIRRIAIVRPPGRRRLPEQPQAQGDRPDRGRVQHDDPDRPGGRRPGRAPESSSASTPTATRSGCNPSRRPTTTATGTVMATDRSPALVRVTSSVAGRGLRSAMRSIGLPILADAAGATIRSPIATTGRSRDDNMFQPASGYPLHRPRRLRGHPRLREMVCETRLAVDDLIYPLFVYHGKDLRREIPSMPGQYQLSLDRLGEAVAEAAELGIPAILLFGIPEHKDARGSAALRDDGIVQEAIRVARRGGARAPGDHRPVLLRVHRPRPLRPAGGNRRPDGRRQRRDAAAPGRAGGQPRPGRGRRDRPLGHDGRHGPGDPPRAGSTPGSSTCRSSPTPPSSPAAITARSARPPRAHRASATAGATRWTRPTPTRRSARSPSTWPRGPT